MKATNFGLILLTYKGKILLMHKQNSVIDEVKHPWGFISVLQEENKSFDIILKKQIYKEMGIKVDNIEILSKFCYHAKLTDANVNSIKRSENQLLDFFSPNEVKKLFLSSLTQEFISKHGLSLSIQNASSF